MTANARARTTLRKLWRLLRSDLGCAACKKPERPWRPMMWHPSGAYVCGDDCFDAIEKARAGEYIDLTFGECEGMCGGMVARVGWDRFCANCLTEQDEQRDELEAAMREEDDYLYGGFTG